MRLGEEMRKWQSVENIKAMKIQKIKVSRKREETNLLSLQQIPPTPDKRKESPGKLKLLTTVDWVEFF